MLLVLPFFCSPATSAFSPVLPQPSTAPAPVPQVIQSLSPSTAPAPVPPQSSADGTAVPGVPQYSTAPAHSAPAQCQHHAVPAHSASSAHQCQPQCQPPCASPSAPVPVQYHSQPQCRASPRIPMCFSPSPHANFLTVPLATPVSHSPHLVPPESSAVSPQYHHAITPCTSVPQLPVPFQPQYRSNPCT
ncbi:extensin-like [Homarus americanus]|uniref:extensin-like n=1 Tax=Homarus americanus TaxID=6706 RepID=UPI001C453744|nr:extensin-like [Homarus americanus]